MNNIIPVRFHNDYIELISIFGEPYAALESIVAGMGLEWDEQYEKIHSKLGSCLEEIEIPGADGGKHKLTFIPLERVPSWVFSNHHKQAPKKLQPKIKLYQQECDDALFAAWESIKPTLSA